MNTPLVIGVDEAGRGPLAGPVCAGAVMLHPARPISGLADSKKLSEKKRYQLAPLIKADAAAWGIGWASVEEIDELNILHATFLAMSRALAECMKRLHAAQDILVAQISADQGLTEQVWSAQFQVDQGLTEQVWPARFSVEQVLQQVLVQVDGNQSPAAYRGPWHWPYATQTVIKGDEKVAEISAASILAKTARDAVMRALHEHYPVYGFAQHAGYGTAQHMASLLQHGPSPVHRKSFAPVSRLLSVSSKVSS